VVVQAVVGVIQLAIALAMLAGYRRSWRLRGLLSQSLVPEGALI